MQTQLKNAVAAQQKVTEAISGAEQSVPFRVELSYLDGAPVVVVTFQGARDLEMEARMREVAKSNPTPFRFEYEGLAG
jgi:hypothetical protein